MFCRNAIQNFVFRSTFVRGLQTSPLFQLNKQEDKESVVEFRDISKDRTKEVPVETSKRYLKSVAYKQTYGDLPVWYQPKDERLKKCMDYLLDTYVDEESDFQQTIWAEAMACLIRITNACQVPYRRNHKGMFPPRKTRKTCIRGGQISTGNPCPICRDEYLVLSEENIELLKQFICPHTGSIISYTKTGLCQKKHFLLCVCIERARDRGMLTFDVPLRKYDYSEYYKPLKSVKDN